MAEPPEVIYVDEESVACDGGGGALGHPRVWLAMDQRGRSECPYCSRQFIMSPAGPSGDAVTTETPAGVTQADPTITVRGDPGVEKL
jgi:uncharacterized Zn-finger protein